MPYISKYRLYLTSDGTRAVLEGDPAAASLLISAGLEVPEADVKRFGLERYMVGAEAKQAAGPTENKVIAPADENKAAPAAPTAPRRGRGRKP